MNNHALQSFSHHSRRHLPFHFFIIPVLLTNLIVTIVYLVRHPSLLTGWLVILSIALLTLAFLVRINPLKVQDRLIRLEEQLRMNTLLPGPLRERIPELTEKQLVALRFASDEEIARLVEETLQNNLSPKDIKKKIEKWRPDYFRV
ncbi:MAG TPA: DUF6526 family protein [Alloacidobacterium sp.]|nr:DUF6526 family protein [Alloacidobacterium sp.]